MSKIKFYEGNGCDQSHLCSISLGDDKDSDHHVNYGDTKKWNLQETNLMSNDEARSVKLSKVPAQTIIKVYDSPSGDKDDDWAEITVKQTVNDYDICIASFEDNYDDENYSIQYHKNNGLQGKVSRVKVTCGPKP